MSQHGNPHSVVAGKQYSPVKHTDTLKVEINRIYIMWPRRVFIQWIIRNPQPNTAYTFQIYRSGSSEGEWSLLGGVFDSDYFFVDEEFGGVEAGVAKANLYSMSRTLYYKLVVEGSDGSTAEVIKQAEPWNDRRHEGIRRKLVRDAYITLKVAMGTEIAVLKRRRWGTLCDCLTSTGQPTVAHCPKCHGTKFLGGFWNPVYTYGQKGSRPINAQVMMEGIVETRQTTSIIPLLPHVEYEDIIVFLREGRRYTVKESNPTQIHNVDVHQELILSELAASSSEYDIPVGPWTEPCWWR